jgi:hypothetical protein
VEVELEFTLLWRTRTSGRWHSSYLRQVGDAGLTELTPSEVFTADAVGSLPGVQYLRQTRKPVGGP